MVVQYKGNGRKIMNIGYEKISERDIRQEKVNQLKKKIQNEINEYRERELFVLKKFENDAYAYKRCILTLTALYAIEDWLKTTYSFMTVSASYENEDIIIYNIHIDTIDLLSQSDFNFIGTFLINLENVPDVEDDSGLGYYFVGNSLNDYYMAHYMVSIFDQMEYERKMNEVENDN